MVLANSSRENLIEQRDRAKAMREKAQEMVRRLRTTDILFGSVTVNVVIILVNLAQVFGSLILVCLHMHYHFDSSAVWWLLLDGIRVLAASIVRIESLLKEADN